MRRGRAVVPFVLTLVIATGGAIDASSQSTVAEPVAADEIPVSVDRIKRHLDRALRAPNAQRLLRLNDYVTVYARLPALDLIENTFDLSDGPIPDGAPTRIEMLNAMTPREWRSPGVNLNNVVGWTVKRINAQR